MMCLRLLMFVLNDSAKRKFMKQFIFSIFILLTVSNFVSSQTDKPKKFEILPCSPKLTESGRQSSFRFSYRYWTLTNEYGLVKKVNYLNPNNSESLADSSDVIPCIEKLKLSPLSKYMIYISFGTTGDENFISISNKAESIKIIL